jgi:hypothetical protein
MWNIQIYTTNKTSQRTTIPENHKTDSSMVKLQSSTPAYTLAYMSEKAINNQ